MSNKSQPAPENLHKVSDFDNKYRKRKESQSFRSLFRFWIRKRTSKCTCKRVLLSNFPIIDSLRSYQLLKDLPGDVVSGLTVGIMHIPRARMAFAALATVQPIVGLYVAFISSLVYFFIGGSRQASFGVIAVVCLMMGSVLDREVPNNENEVSSDVTNNVTNGSATSDNSDYESRKIQVASAVSFVSGLFLIALGKLGCGFVTTYMPDSLIRGFTTGAATHVAISQTSPVLGIKIPRHSGPLKAILTVVEICKHLPDVNWMPLVISLVSMVIMYVVRIHVNQRYAKKIKIPIPIELIVMILSIVISKYCDLNDDYSLKIVGDIPTGIPKPTFPDLSLAKSCISDAFAIGVVAFAQSVALAKTFAIKNGYNIDANQEMFAYGVCTSVSSLFSGMVAAASMARSIVQDGTGGVSQIASLIGCVIVLMVILFLGPLFYYLPFCILSSVIIVNLRGMFRQFLLLKPYWRQSKADIILFLVTYLAVVFIDVDIGLAVGVAVSVFSVVIRTQRADFSELGQVDDLDVYKPVSSYDKTFTNSTTSVLRFGSPLYFANSEMFQKRVYKLLGIDINKLKKQKLAAKNSDIPMSTLSQQGEKDDVQNGDRNDEAWNTSSPSNLRHVILDLSGATFMDSMGATALKKVICDLEIVGIYLYVVGLPDPSYHVVKTTDVWDKCSDHFYICLQDVVDEVNTVSVHL